MCLIATFMFSTIIGWGGGGGMRVHVIFAFTSCHFQSSPCGKYIPLGGNCLLPAFHFHPDNLVCFYLSRMARGDHQNDDDDFMDPPQHNRATGRRKDGDEVTVHTPSSSCICYWLPPRACNRLLRTTTSWQWKHGNKWSFVSFCRRRNVLATGPLRNDLLHWLTDLPTIRRELLLRWVCKLWWMSGAWI